MITLRQLSYHLTVSLPLELCITVLRPFLKRAHVSKALHNLLNERGLRGTLPDGNHVCYPLDDFKLCAIISEIYDRKVYDVSKAQSAELICDVGAHIGLFTLSVSKQAPNSRIIATEPDPVSFGFLLRNLSLNRLKGRVEALQVAAGEGRGTAAIFLSETSRGDNSMKRWHDAGTAGTLMVGVLPLDEVLSKESVCDVMKIDVEGMELEVLRGLEKHYAKVRRLVMEIHTSVVSASESMIG